MVSPVVHITTERGMSGESGVHNSFEMRVAVGVNYEFLCNIGGSKSCYIQFLAL